MANWFCDFKNMTYIFILHSFFTKKKHYSPKNIIGVLENSWRGYRPCDLNTAFEKKKEKRIEAFRKTMVK